jgi:glycosyltransferase involved in cell wall biosynthesis
VDYAKEGTVKSISVIIPCRNRADILGHTLAALGRQSFPGAEFEVVVVDDGSTDDTAALVRSGRYPFSSVYVRLEPREELCIARPRNHGLLAATGEIALFIDADILAFPELVAEHVAAHRAGSRVKGQGSRFEVARKGSAFDPRPLTLEGRAVIGYTYAYPVQPAERTPEAMDPPQPERLLEELPGLVERDGTRWRDGREPIYAETRDLAEHPHPWQMFWGHNVSVPRALALEIGGFDEEFVGWGVEDLEFAYRLFRRGVSFHVARGACAAHYPHALPDLDARWAQLQRNRRRLIAKHPDPALELRLWNARAYAAEWPRVADLWDSPPYAARDAEVVAAIERLRADRLPEGPLLLCGEFPPGAVARWQPAAWCRPFGRGGAPSSLPLLGVFTPWEEGAFAAAVVWDYWRRLSAAVLEGLVAELQRVARCVALVTPERDPMAAPLPTAAWKRWETDGVTEWILRSGE